MYQPDISICIIGAATSGKNRTAEIISGTPNKRNRYEAQNSQSDVIIISSDEEDEPFDISYKYIYKNKETYNDEGVEDEPFDLSNLPTVVNRIPYIIEELEDEPLDFADPPTVKNKIPYIIDDASFQIAVPIHSNKRVEGESSHIPDPPVDKNQKAPIIEDEAFYTAGVIEKPHNIEGVKADQLHIAGPSICQKLKPFTIKGVIDEPFHIPPSTLYEELMALNNGNLVENQEPFICEHCLTICEPKAGVILTECVHSICKKCVSRIVETTDNVEIQCPFRDNDYSCDKIIPHRELMKIVRPELFDRFLQRSISGVIEDIPKAPQTSDEVTKPDLFEEMVVLNKQHLVENRELFECGVCLTECEPHMGIILTECLHVFCKECISSIVEMTTDVVIKCPFRNNEYSCDKVIQHREIKQIVSQEVFDKFLHKSISITMHGVKEASNCQSTDCNGWFYVVGGHYFMCPICKKINCCLCKGLHDPSIITCKEFAQTQEDPNEHTEKLLKHMISRNKAMKCPCCGVVIQKADGCDFVICLRCKTQICWITRGPRWGPNGPGDTSGGCRCNVDNKKCHPKCNNCH